MGAPAPPGAAVDYLSGDWSAEFTPQRVDLRAGELHLGSRQGITSHSFAPTLRCRRSTATAAVRAYGVALAWSGSWRMLVELRPSAARVRVAGGVSTTSPASSRWTAGVVATARTILGVRAPAAPTGLRVRGTTIERGWLSRDDRSGAPAVVYNSWYATTFDVANEQQLALADVAAELGAEVFVVDDGWFRGRDQ